MRNRQVLWILIADGEHARIVIPGKRAGSFHTLASFNSPRAHLRTSDLGTDPPGRSFESAGTARHAIEARHDRHRMEMEHFAERIAANLASAATIGRFDKLVLVAPARMMHAIRSALSETAASLVVGTLGKDLLKVPDHALGEHLAEWARFPQEA